MTALSRQLTPAATPGTTGVPALDGARVLLVHQWLYTWAGAERVLEHLAAMIPQADVLSGLVTPGIRRAHPIAARAQESWAGRLPFGRTHHRWFLPAHALAFATFDTRAYDVVISVSHAFEKMVRRRKADAVHISYCLSPPRYLWDLQDAHDELATPMQRLALRAARGPLRALDRRSANHVDRFISLSRHVAERVRRAYGRESAVVYPPVSRKPAPPMPSVRDRFLFTLGRLVPYKRLDLAIAAAERLGIRLLIAGDGPERPRLERLAGSHTEFLGTISEERAGELLSRCAAFVFCAEEDFGIAPVEAMSHGAPVVAFGRGGALETISDGVSGVFFREQHVDAVADAITRCLEHSWDDERVRACAAAFAPERFRAAMAAEITAEVSNGRRRAIR
jgi:glycosyltransferase involved in cell wall biosynthesis